MMSRLSIAKDTVVVIRFTWDTAQMIILLTMIWKLIKVETVIEVP